jgi:DnaJ-domain-containing protein 1
MGYGLEKMLQQQTPALDNLLDDATDSLYQCSLASGINTNGKRSPQESNAERLKRLKAAAEKQIERQKLLDERVASTKAQLKSLTDMKAVISRKKAKYMTRYETELENATRDDLLELNRIKQSMSPGHVSLQEDEEPLEYIDDNTTAHDGATEE